MEKLVLTAKALPTLSEKEKGDLHGQPQKPKGYGMLGSALHKGWQAPNLSFQK